MEISQAILDNLTAKAKASERLRMNLDLRHGRGRVPGSNRQTPRGKHRVEYYDELGICTESFVIEPGGENVAVSIPIGMWHTVHALESGTCILAWQGTGTWHQQQSMAGDTWQGTGTWQQQANASEKINPFPGRLSFLDAFLKFYVRFVWRY